MKKLNRSEAAIYCHKDRSDNVSLCIAGSYKSKCNKTKCFRLPGETCRIKNAEIYGGKCHDEAFCGCEGRCIGYVRVDGKEFEHNDEYCMSLKKRNYPRLSLDNLIGNKNNLNYQLFDQVNL